MNIFNFKFKKLLIYTIALFLIKTSPNRASDVASDIETRIACTAQLCLKQSKAKYFPEVIKKIMEFVSERKWVLYKRLPCPSDTYLTSEGIFSLHRTSDKNSPTSDKNSPNKILLANHMTRNIKTIQPIPDTIESTITSNNGKIIAIQTGTSMNVWNAESNSLSTIPLSQVIDYTLSNNGETIGVLTNDQENNKNTDTQSVSIYTTTGTLELIATHKLTQPWCNTIKSSKDSIITYYDNPECYDDKEDITLTVVNGQTKREIPLKNIDANLPLWHFSRGSITFRTSDDIIHNLNLDSGNATELEDPDGCICSLAISPDSEIIAGVASNSDNMTVWNTQSGASDNYFPLTDSNNDYYQSHSNTVLTFSPNSKNIAFRVANGQTKIIDAYTGETETELLGRPDDVYPYNQNNKICFSKTGNLGVQTGNTIELFRKKISIPLKSEDIKSRQIYSDTYMNNRDAIYPTIENDVWKEFSRAIKKDIEEKDAKDDKKNLKRKHSEISDFQNHQVSDSQNPTISALFSDNNTPDSTFKTSLSDLLKNNNIQGTPRRNIQNASDLLNLKEKTTP